MERTTKALLLGLAAVCLLMACGVHGGCCDELPVVPGANSCIPQVTKAMCDGMGGKYKAGSGLLLPGNWICQGGTTCVCPSGSMCGDPHITGFDGSHYLLWGKEDKSYDILSERNHQVNAHLFDDTPVDKRQGSHALFIDAMGIMINDARITVRMVGANAAGVEPEVVTAISAAKTARTQRLVVSTAAPDGTKRHAVWTGKSATQAVDSFTSYTFTDEYHVTISSSQITLTVLLRNDHHLDFQVNAIAPSWSKVHGVLGQTYAAAFGAGGVAAAGGGAAEGAPKVTGKKYNLEGKEDEYITSGLLSADDKYSQFVVGGTKLYAMIADGSAVSRKMLKAGAGVTGGSAAGGNGPQDDVLLGMALPCDAGVVGDEL